MSIGLYRGCEAPNVDHPVGEDAQRGFTALELIIVLIIALSIIAISASRMGDLFTASNTTSAASNVMSLYTATRAFESINGYGADGTDLLALLKKSGGLPSGLSISGDKVTNEWGGEIKVEALNQGHGFQITYSQVPAAVCTKLATQLLASGNFTAIKIGSVEITQAGDMTAIVDAVSTLNNGVGDMVFVVNGPNSGPT